MIKKNDIIIATCSNLNHEGMGIVKVDGFALFVNNLLVGEKAEIIVTLVKKNYGYGKVLHLLEKSVDRQEPICPIFKSCGGCQLQHLKYEKQLEFKTNKVKEVLQRIGKIDVKVNDCLGMDLPYYYRNKAQVPFGCENNTVIAGFYRVNSHDIIKMDKCYLQSDVANELINEIRDFLNQNKIKNKVRYVLIKYAKSTDEVMVVLIVNKNKLFKEQILVSRLVSKFPNIKSIILNVNDRNDNVILGEEERVLYGSSYIQDILQDIRFNISSKSFYQVNPIQTLHLYEYALKLADLKASDSVLDLYCGVGTISLFLAKKAKKVIGIEIVKEAIEDAKENARINGINNVEFICCDAKDYARSLNEKIDVVMVDPPRKGLDKETINDISRINPDRLVYISCDPATLARDLALFSELNYQILEVQPVDMFCQTHHVETVVLLDRK